LFSERVRSLWNSQNSARPIGDGLVRRDWFSIENKADATDVFIFDAIMEGGTSAGQFQQELNAVKSPIINLYLNSPGGLVHEGTAIYNALKQHPARVHAQVQGIAASIASVIFMAGDTREMSPGSLAMIHPAHGMVLGNAKDMRQAAEVLDTMTDSIAGIYASRSKKDVSHWRALMDAETWFNEQEAVVAGLADSVVGQATTKPTNQLEPEASQPDWRIAARRMVAAAHMEVIRGYAH
jgi:ATP-dependent protease ClpP protease subunit